MHLWYVACLVQIVAIIWLVRQTVPVRHQGMALAAAVGARITTKECGRHDTRQIRGQRLSTKYTERIAHPADAGALKLADSTVYKLLQSFTMSPIRRILSDQQHTTCLTRLFHQNATFIRIEGDRFLQQHMLPCLQRSHRMFEVRRRLQVA